jgi:uncharacterized protein YdcH (DUF465 family)
VTVLPGKVLVSWIIFQAFWSNSLPTLQSSGPPQRRMEHHILSLLQVQGYGQQILQGMASIFEKIHLLNYPRMIRNFTTKDAAVAKLFAKHIKLKDAIRFLKSTRTGIAVGTPARLDDLMEDGMVLLSCRVENPN